MCSFLIGQLLCLYMYIVDVCGLWIAMMIVPFLLSGIFCFVCLFGRWFQAAYVTEAIWKEDTKNSLQYSQFVSLNYLGAVEFQ